MEKVIIFASLPPHQNPPLPCSMRPPISHLPAFTLALCAAGMLLAACTVQGATMIAPPGNAALSVDPAFRELYSLLGGEPVLGAPISQAFEYHDLQMQYTEKALLRFDPQAEPASQYSLAPLGSDLGIHDEPLVLPAQPDQRVVDGYILYEEFIPLYEQLQAERFAGKPLTQVRVNSEMGRIEQYFTNAGFFRSLSDPPGKARLLAYGSWKCVQACRSLSDSMAEIVLPEEYPQPFAASIARIGPELFGQPLTATYIAPDGMLEQVYENVVLYADPAGSSLTGLRSLAGLPGYPLAEPAPPINDERMVFYPQQENLGFNVPRVFEEYIVQHGGLEISGQPVSQLVPEAAAYRQCFANYCLDYDPAAAEGARIRPVPFGWIYLEQVQPVVAQPAATAPFAGPVEVLVNELHPRLSPYQEQQVTIQVLDASTQSPVPGVSARLELSLPDGRLLTYNFAPTNPDGQATLSIPAFDASPGTLFSYQVCANPASAQPVCVLDSYVIWAD